MSLETGDILELRAKPEVYLSDAGIPLNVAGAAERLDIYEPEEHGRETAAETTSAGLTLPDLSIGEDDVGRPSAFEAVPERLEIKTTEEFEKEFEVDFTKDLLHLLLVSENAENPLDTVTELEHLEGGEDEDPNQEEPGAEVANADLIVPDSSTESNDSVTLSYRDAVLEDGGVEEPSTDDDAAEVASTDLNVPDSSTESNDSVTLSYRDAVLEDEGIEEPTTEEDTAEVASTDLNVPDSSTDSKDVVALSYRDVVSEDGGIEEPSTEEHPAEVASTDLNVPDSSIDINDSVTLSYRDAVLEDGGIEEPTEENATEVANVDLDVPDSSTDSKDVVTLSHGDAVLEDGEGEDLKDERAAEGSIADPVVPDSLANSNDAVVPDSLANSNDAVSVLNLATSTNCSAMLPTEEATKDEDHVEGLVDDTRSVDAVEVCSLPCEAVVQDGVDNVQVNPENANAKNEPESIFENTDGSEATPILEGAAGYLSSPNQLPLEVGKHVIQLQCESSAPNGVCQVSIVGTAHVSKASCEEVQALIRHIKPEVVFLELCSSRTNVLLPTKREVPTLSSMIEMYKKKQMNLFGILYCWFLAKVGEKLEVTPGTEFRVAYEEAVRCGASVTLGDRPIQITLQRTWRKMSFWHKTKFICSMVTASFSLPSSDEFQALMDKMGQSDELTIMIQELSKTYPTLLETLLSERDLYMVASLRRVARCYSSVVAVVGRGHLSGIADHWKEDISVDELMVVPPKKPLSRIWLWGTVALGVGGIVAGVNLLRRR
ncbi:hypothetical protein KC19_5G033800 [Ceratodon purpureus]|uniref:TraB n=1 Tax=Ceratodon purpureus TaxID=3225 RepID=A0A8T0HY86_CERPU|nr:hypothetical protein KC19_5G033800 [Ceratodon purpureus]